MFIGICGSICSGKTTVAQYLIDHHGFRHLRLDAILPSIEDDGLSAAAAAAAAAAEPGSSSSNTAAPRRPEASASAAAPAAPGHQGRGGGHHHPHHQLSLRASRQAPLSFPTADDLLDFVTRRWQDRWVTTDLPSEAVLDTYSGRPFFLLISVDAPLTVRWRRFQERQQQQEQQQQKPQGAAPLAPPGGGSPPAADALDAFARLSDAHLYDAHAGHCALMARASVRLLNTSSSLAHLYATLGKVDLLHGDRLRPGWDTYFMALASLAARRSNCMRRRVGCVLVRQRRVLATGYNGTPRGLRNCGEGGCPRCNDAPGSGQGLATCLCIHAEENALLEAGRERIREGATLYCDTCPCLTCSIKIAQVGIGEVVYSQSYSMDGATAAVFREAGVKLRQFVPPANGLIHLEKMELYN